MSTLVKNKKQKKTFEDFLYSLRAITIPMMMVILGICIKASVLFNMSFVAISNEWVRLATSIFMGSAVGFTVLMVSINSDLLTPSRKNKYDEDIKFGFPEAFSLASLMMMLLIFQVFDGGISLSLMITKVFLSLFFAAIEYTYSKLFVRKRQKIKADKLEEEERLKQEKLEEEERLRKLEKENSDEEYNSELINELEEKILNLQASNDKYKKILNIEE